MKTQILEKLNDLKNRSGKSFEAVHDALGFAASTVHRWHKGESVPDIDDLTALVEFYGGSMEDLFAAVGKQEMTATQTIGYQGAEAMVEHYEARLEAKDAMIAQLKEHHAQRIEQEQQHHEKSIEYLKNEIDRLRGERDSARDTSLQVVSKKHTVYQNMFVACIILGVTIVLLIVLLIIAFKTDAIL